MLDLKNKFGMENEFYIRSKGKRGAKRRSGFVEIYGQDKELADKKGISCRQDSDINASMKLGFTI